MYGDDMTTAVVAEENHKGDLSYWLYDIFQDTYNKNDIFELRSFNAYKTVEDAIKALYNVTKSKNILDNEGNTFDNTIDHSDTA